MRLLKIPVALPVLFLAILIVYLPGLGIPYYGDDFQHVFDGSASVLERFTHANPHPNSGWYRPLEDGYLAVVQKHFDRNTVPIHLLAVLLHALLCCLVLAAVMELGYPPAYAIIAAAFFAFSQAGAFALLSNDTLSQMMGAFFGCLALWALLKRRRGAFYYVIGVAAFALALLSKESGISFFPIIVLAIVVLDKKPGRYAMDWKRAVAEAAPYFAVLLVYLVSRVALSANQPAFGAARYQFRIGSNVFVNLAEDLFALAIPASTVAAFEAIQARDTALLGAIAASALVFLAVVGYGLWLRRRDARIYVIAIFLAGSAFPMVLMNHVSELYVYNSMPFFAALVGIGIGALWERAGSAAARGALAGAMVVLIASHVVAIRGKAVLMRTNGDRASALFREVGAYIPRVPRNGQLLLLNPPEHSRGEYAVYRLNGFSVLEDGELLLKKTYGREDITLQIVDPGDPALVRLGTDTVVLGLEDGGLKLLNRPPKSPLAASPNIIKTDSIP